MPSVAQLSLKKQERLKRHEKIDAVLKYFCFEEESVWMFRWTSVKQLSDVCLMEYSLLWFLWIEMFRFVWTTLDTSLTHLSCDDDESDVLIGWRPHPKDWTPASVSEIQMWDRMSAMASQDVLNVFYSHSVSSCSRLIYELGSLKLFLEDWGLKTFFKSVSRRRERERWGERERDRGMRGRERKGGGRESDRGRERERQRGRERESRGGGGERRGGGGGGNSQQP